MTQVGTISKISDVDFKGTILWSFQTEEAGNVWFRTGTVKPPVEMGKAYKFDVGDKNKVDLKGITEISADELAKAPAAASGTVPKTRENYWSDKADFEKQMQPVWDWGRARSDAAAVVQVALTTGALEFPKSANNAKKLGLITAYLHEVTQELITKESELK